MCINYAKDPFILGILLQLKVSFKMGPFSNPGHMYISGYFDIGVFFVFFCSFSKVFIGVVTSGPYSLLGTKIHRLLHIVHVC